MFLYETHMHTSTVSACAISTPAEQVFAYKKKGYTGVIITDHFINGNAHNTGRMPWADKMRFFISGYEKAVAAGKNCNLDVFLGWEYTIGGHDFLTYGLDMQFLLAHPSVAAMEIKQYSALVRKNGGYLAQAHPYRQGFWINDPRPVDPKFLDGVEVHNNQMPDSVNRKAYTFAQKHNLPMQAGSDSHDAEQRYFSGIKLREKAKTIHDIIKALKANESELIIPS